MPFYPTDWESVMQLALWTWVDGVLSGLGAGWTTIWSDGQGPGQTEQGPTPAHPFASLSALGPPLEEVPTSAVGVDTGPTTMTARARTGGKFTFEVQLYSLNRGLNVTAAATLRHSVAQSYPYGEALEAAGLVTAEPILERDLSAIRGTSKEFRQIVEFPLRVEIRTDTPNSPWIETVTPPVLNFM